MRTVSVNSEQGEGLGRVSVGERIVSIGEESSIRNGSQTRGTLEAKN